MKKHNTISLLDYILLSIVLGVLSTLSTYGYGIGNHIEQLPMILRVLDPSYLSNDFFTNASIAMGPRFYFAKVVAWLAHYIPLPITYLVLTSLSNILITFITCLLACKLFAENQIAGILAGCVVMSIPTFFLGYNASIYDGMLTPAHLIMPLIFYAIWHGIYQHVIRATFFAGIASIIHPLFGLETAAILILIALLKKKPAKSGSTEKWYQHFVSIVIALLFLCFFTLIWFLPSRSMHRIPTDTFIQILAFFRHPHHYVPSAFGGRMIYLEAACFILATGIAWYWRAGTSLTIFPKREVFIFTIIILCLCLGGYIGVEIFPSKFWTTIQPFRLLFLIKWLGLIFISGMVGTLISRDSYDCDGYIILMSTLSPFALGVVLTAKIYRKFITQHVPALTWYVSPGALFIYSISIILYFHSDVIVLFPLYLFLGFSLLMGSKKIVYLGIAAGTITLLFVWSSPIAPLKLPERLQALGGKLLSPQICIEDLSGVDIDIAEYSRDYITKKALFLVPPTWGHFRLTARRAIVVDWKAFPFQEEKIIEWQQRIFDCYGTPESSGGLPALLEMERNYQTINAERLHDVVEKYHVTHIILYRQTPTMLPVLYENQQYKLVYVNKGD
ncbi:hypothetical protein CSB45_14000 [candidate division KSB3 bacterium]|uniref:DUF6798 domain-containing protein n=1 Tax=candidate division KSB3 bacterium TaxID=2044937 RepID=A0A2G6E152_9BACT|nr:MAG: hypothetical protein CSB45_14000 [candidate division KSB3 bacterium]PIE28439.1 MAG: hypothetical protein CSA57_13645 [candidate division KSB3 bacterium]